MEDFDVAVSSIVVAGGHNQGVAASPVDGSAWSTRRPQHLHDGGPVGEVRPDFEGPPPDSVVHRLPLTPPRHHSLGVSRGPGPGVGPDEKTQLMLICSTANSSNYSVG